MKLLFDGCGCDGECKCNEGNCSDGKCGDDGEKSGGGYGQQGGE